MTDSIMLKSAPELNNGMIECFLVCTNCALHFVGFISSYGQMQCCVGFLANQSSILFSRVIQQVE